MEVLDEGEVVGLDVVHGAAHPGEALAETQVVGGIGLGRFALGPVPAAAVLKITDEDGVTGNGGATVLEAQVVDAAQGFLEDLGGHDGGAD